MKQAVAYVRVSSKEQHQEGFSIPAQRKLLEAYALEKDIQIVQVFEEVETAKQAGRKSFGAMLTFLKRSANCETILVEKTDRLYRNIRDWATLDDAKVEIHFVKANFIRNNEAKSSEKFVHGIQVLMAKNYVDNLSEETSKGMLEKARQGLYPSFAPLGYLNDKETASIIPDPERAPLIRKLFEAYATGRESYKSITKLAFQMGLRSRKGNKVSKANIGKLLNKLTFTGSFVWKGVTYQGTYEPIVSKALFAEVQNRINAVTYSNPQKHDHAFRGLVRCGQCECMVTGETKQSLIYEDKLDGTITKEFWKRKNEEYSVRLNWIKGEIEKFS